MSWITESNRTEHLLYGAIAAYFGTILFAIGAAFGIEFKDFQYGGKFDFLDITATIIGGIVGQVLQGINILIFIAWIETSNLFLFLLFVAYFSLLVAVSAHYINKLHEIR